MLDILLFSIKEYVQEHYRIVMLLYILSYIGNQIHGNVYSWMLVYVLDYLLQN